MTDAIPEGWVLPESDDELLAECRVETFRSGGPGGQHQNTTDSGVRLTHLPTGVRVSARRERSQHRNKADALRRLRQRLTELATEPEPRKPTKVPRGSKAERLREKRRRGERKRLRRPPSTDD